MNTAQLIHDIWIDGGNTAELKPRCVKFVTSHLIKVRLYLTKTCSQRLLIMKSKLQTSTNEAKSKGKIPSSNH